MAGLGNGALLLLICVGLALGAPASADTEKRVALVIGNGAYDAGAKLANPVNDARAMAGKLKGLGFEVISVENGTHQMMRQAVVQFSNRLSADSVSLFYYAGHGMQVNGRNYLIPVDADITTEQTVRLVTIDVDSVIEQMSMAKSRVNLVILDACRNNPYERRFRSQSGGLATMEAPTGTLIAYATSPGKVAGDGDTGNGLYTSELIKAVDVSGATVAQVFQQVRRNVVTRSKGDQTPWEATSLTGDFYFNARLPEPPAVAPAAVADRDALFWSTVKDSRDPAEIQAYLDAFPHGTFAGLAQVILANLKKTQVAAIPAKPDVAPAPPVDIGPAIEEVEGAYITLKRANVREKPVADGKLLKALDPGVLLTVTGKVKDTQWFRVTSVDGKLRGFVFGDAIQDIKAAEEADWQRVKDAKQSAVVAGFLRRFPSGVYADQAKALRDELAKHEQAALILAAEQKAEADRQAEEKRKAEEARKAETERKAEAQRLADGQRAAAAAEAKRQSEEQARQRAEMERAAEAQRQAEAARHLEEQRKVAAAEEERRRVEAEVQRQAAAAEEARERTEAEKQRQAQEAEVRRQAAVAPPPAQVAMAAPTPDQLNGEWIGKAELWSMVASLQGRKLSGVLSCRDGMLRYRFSGELDQNGRIDMWASSSTISARPLSFPVKGTFPTVVITGIVGVGVGGGVSGGGIVGGTECNSETLTAHRKG